MKFVDFNDPFFKPLWIRIAVVCGPALWGLFEFYNGENTWGLMFIGLAVWGFYGLFIKFDPRDPEPKDVKSENDK